MLRQIDQQGKKVTVKMKVVKVNPLVEVFVQEQVLKQEKFSLATLFPNPWPQELLPLYNQFKDETQAAYALSDLVRTVLAQDPEEWLTVKTNITGRDFETCFYWRADNAKFQHGDKH